LTTATIGTMPDVKYLDVACVLCDTKWPDVMLTDGLCEHCAPQVPPDEDLTPGSDADITALFGGQLD
jgi:hypothetical protein